MDWAEGLAWQPTACHSHPQLWMETEVLKTQDFSAFQNPGPSQRLLHMESSRTAGCSHRGPKGAK